MQRFERASWPSTRAERRPCKLKARRPRYRLGLAISAFRSKRRILRRSGRHRQSDLGPINREREDKRSACLGKVARLDRSSMVFRSEEHTSELQSQSNIVCRLLHEIK